MQVKNEINSLKTRRNEELDHIILGNRHLARPDRDGKEKVIDEIEKSIREKENELKNLLIMSLLIMSLLICY